MATVVGTVTGAMLLFNTQGHTVLATFFHTLNSVKTVNICELHCATLRYYDPCDKVWRDEFCQDSVAHQSCLCFESGVEQVEVLT